MEGGDLRVSNTIDTKVVEMKFDNATFERGVAQTLKTLANLKSGLKLDGATKGLEEVNKAAGKFNLGNMAGHLQQIAGRFSTMGIIGVTALASIATQALRTGAAMLKSLTVTPLKAGLEEYETNLNSIQTILANTGLEGKAGLQQVTGALDELNHYADNTIYNFSEMARNIGTFTAAGIKLGPATAAIKGIANLAAVSGSNAEQASTAMYQLSQAMAAGKATLVDWNSVVNAGMGGKVFQEALKETARVQGQNVDAIIKKNGSFRDSLQDGWLTTKVLTETLQKFTGDLSKEQLKSMGYNDKQIAGILKMGKTAQDAATKVKTMSQLINTLQEAASSGWATTWQLVFGDFDEAKTLFTNVSSVLGGFVQKSSDARNKVIGDWKKMGGRAAIIQGISNVFNSLLAVLKPIKDAFREIFPPVTGQQLAALSKQFLAFTQHLKVGSETAKNIKRTFAGVFAIFSIGIQILKGVGTIIATVFKSFSGGSGGILEFTGNIGDWLVKLNEAIKSGKGFHDFFVKIGTVIAKPIELLKKFVNYLKQIKVDFSGFTEAGGAAADKVQERFKPLGKLGGLISKAWTGVVKLLKSAWTSFSSLGDKFSEFFTNLGDGISNGLGNIDYKGILDGVSTGLLAGLVLLFKKFLSGGINIDLGGGFLDKIKDSFEGLTGVMGAMQAQLKAGALMKIAIAIALLTVSVVALSLIDSKKLASALVGLSAMFIQLLAAMAIFAKITASAGFVKMPVMTASLILLAIAIDLLAIAVGKLSGLSWEELAKGLTGVGALLASLALFTKFAAVEKGGVKSGAGLILLALAIKLLVDSVKDLSGMDWESLAKGLTGVAGLLVALALYTKLSAANAGGISQGAGIILLAVGIRILSKAVADMGQLSWTEIAKGLVTLGGALAFIAGALSLMPPSSIFSAAGILVVALSLGKIGDAIQRMGEMKGSVIGKGLLAMAGGLAAIALALALLPPSSLLSAAAIFVVAASLGMIGDSLQQSGQMSWEEIAKGLVVLAGSLVIIAGALYLMTAALPGAAALVIAAAALKLLAPVLLAFGGMSWEEIGKGLLMLAGVFAVLGVAGLVLAPVVPVLIGLGAAVALLGVGMLAAGAGLLLFSIGLTALAASGAAGTAAIVNIVKQLALLLPFVMIQVGVAIGALAGVLAKQGPQFTAAMVTVLLSLMSAIDKTSPKVVATMERLLTLLLGALVRSVPKISAAGLAILIGFLGIISKNIGKVVTVSTDIIVNFLKGITNNLPRVIQAGVDLVLALINGIASAIRNNSEAVGAAGANLGTAIIEGMVRGMAGGIGQVTSKAKELASTALSAAKGVLGIKSPSKEFFKIGQFVVQGFVKGLDGNKASINNAFYTMRAQLADFRREAAQDIGRLSDNLSKLEKARHKDRAAIRATKNALAQARVEYAKSNNAYNVLTKSLFDETTMLGKLADKYDVYTAKINKAQQALADITKTRDDYAKSVADQYSDLATPEDDQSLGDFLAQEKKKLADIKTYAALLQKLRKLGLNNEAYMDLLAKGPAGTKFAQELLASGKSGVNQINLVSKDLDAWGASLGKVAAANLYQAGVNAAAGLVKGLQAQQAAIEKQMDKIAAIMLKALKKALGIKSPSREFMEVARYSVEGMTDGFDKYAIVAGKSAKNVGETALEALRKSMSDISKVVITDSNFNPIIRPVLDLTAVKTDASRIAGLLAAQPLKVDAALARANDISASYRNNRTAEQTPPETSKVDVTFNQTNNSPKAISAAETYRNTKNQLSVAKGVLGNVK
jgi:tape measure domain-containing protein